MISTLISTPGTSITDRLLPFASLLVLFAQACSGSRTQSAAPKDKPTDPGQPVTPTPSDTRQGELLALQATLASAESMDAASLASAHALPSASALGYDPLSATNLALVQSGALKLTAGELDNLGRIAATVARPNA
jgi:hypothetical protein